MQNRQRGAHEEAQQRGGAQLLQRLCGDARGPLGKWRQSGHGHREGFMHKEVGEPGRGEVVKDLSSSLRTSDLTGNSSEVFSRGEWDSP